MKVTIGPAVETDQAMPMRAVMTMPPDWVIGAYISAVERSKTAARSGAETSRDISIAVAETLMWLDVLAQTDRNVGRGRELAKELSRDPLVKALRFFRARTHHHLSSVGPFDSAVGTWVWIPAANIPLPPGEQHLNPKGDKLYRKLLEGHPVVDGLELVAMRLKGYVRATEHSS